MREKRVMLEANYTGSKLKWDVQNKMSTDVRQKNNSESMGC